MQIKIQKNDIPIIKLMGASIADILFSKQEKKDKKRKINLFKIKAR
jgi:hypothetical protein